MIKKHQKKKMIEKKYTAITVDLDTYDLIATQAEKSGLSKSAYIRQQINKELPKKSLTMGEWHKNWEAKHGKITAKKKIRITNDDINEGWGIRFNR
ncbi:MAG: hypothetical protein WCJ58_06845 [bacterium]